jgi:hypothetical protein
VQRPGLEVGCHGAQHGDVLLTELPSAGRYSRPGGAREVAVDGAIGVATVAKNSASVSPIEPYRGGTSR